MNAENLNKHKSIPSSKVHRSWVLFCVTTVCVLQICGSICPWVDTITVEGGHTQLQEPQAEKSKLFCFSGQRVAVDNVAAPTCGSSCHVSSHWGLSSPHCPSSCCSPRGPQSKPYQHRREAFAAHLGDLCHNTRPSV